MVKSFISGAIIGAVYECVRVLRMLVCPSEQGRLASLRRGAEIILVFVSDLVFCLLFAVTALLLTYNISGGIFRGCVYLCMGLGWLIYRLTVGRLTYKIEKKLTFFIKKVLKRLLKLFFVPIRAIILLIVRLYTLTIGKKLCKIRCKLKEKREKRETERKKKREKTEDVPMLPPPEEEENKNADKGYKYRNECRKSFSGHRGA